MFDFFHVFITPNKRMLAIFVVEKIRSIKQLCKRSLLFLSSFLYNLAGVYDYLAMDVSK